MLGRCMQRHRHQEFLFIWVKTPAQILAKTES
jgi:hypothetical protein